LQERSIVVSFFEQGGKFVRCETRDRADGGYELSIEWPDGATRVEQFSNAAALDDRLMQLQRSFLSEGWFGPYGQRS
jgi:hypothetical protein